MTTHFCSQIRLVLATLLLLAALPALAAIGQVDFVVGQVTITTASGQESKAVRGSELNSGDTIKTGEASTAQLRFSDGAMLSLRPNTEFRVDDYRFNGKPDGSEKGFFSLIKGGLRTITGLIGKTSRNSYRMNTMVATVGIRGTEYSLNFTGGENGILEIQTAQGAVSVSNGGGCLVVAAGGSATVSGVGGAPTGVGGATGGCNQVPETLPERLLTPPGNNTLEGVAPTKPANTSPNTRGAGATANTQQAPSTAPSGNFPNGVPTNNLPTNRGR